MLKNVFHLAESTTTTSILTTASCGAGYVRHLSGTRVNLLVDDFDWGYISGTCAECCTCRFGVCRKENPLLPSPVEECYLIY